MSSLDSAFSVTDFLSQCQGRPIRVSLFSPVYKDCLGRYPGILIKVLTDSLWVDCLDAPPTSPVGTRVTLEFVHQGEIFWCHASLLAGFADAPNTLHLSWPDSVQVTQRRQSPRVDTNVPVHYLADGDSRPAQGVIINLSEGGAALQGPTPLTPEQSVALVFSLGSGLFLQDIRAKVLRCNATQSGTWLSGLQFQELTAEQFASISSWVRRRVENAPTPNRWGLRP